MLKNPANRHKAVGFTKEQFHYAFTNTLPIGLESSYSSNVGEEEFSEVHGGMCDKGLKGLGRT